MAWELITERPIFLLCTTDIINIDLGLRDPLRFLAELLLEQTGGVQVDDALERWVRRFFKTGASARLTR